MYPPLILDVIFLIVAVSVSYPVYKFVWGVNFGVARPGSSRFYILTLGVVCLLLSVLRILIQLGAFDGVMSSIDSYPTWARFCFWSMFWLEAFSPLLFSIFLASSIFALYGVRHLHVSLNAAFFAAVLGLFFGVLDTGIPILILISLGIPLNGFFEIGGALSTIAFVVRFISVALIFVVVSATYSRNLRRM